MKKFFGIAAAALFICATAACSGSDSGEEETMDRAESAYSDGRMARAQALCDSLLLGDEFSSLDARDLCRLSLLFMRLGENSGEPEINTAFAARCLDAAFERDSDSTAVYINAMPVEDQARIMLLNSLNKASHSAPEEEIEYEDTSNF